MGLSFPKSKPIVDGLAITHPEFNAGRIQKIQDFYEGGEGFECRKKDYLVTRMADTSKAYLQARINTAEFTPELGDKTDDLAGCIMRDPPRIITKDTEDPRSKYWSNLNDDIDGYGHSLASLVRSRLVQTMLHDRSYFTMQWPDISATGILEEDKKVQPGNKRARLDIRIGEQNAACVDDWEFDDEGCELLWVRCHTWRVVRGPTGIWDTERHRWTFVDDQATAVYVADRKLNSQGQPKPWAKSDLARLQGEPQVHSLGYLPTFLIPAPEGISFGCRLIATYKALFNKEAALSFAEFAGALNVPFYKGGTKPGNINMNELGFLYLGEDGEFGWTAPPAHIFVALAAACDRLRQRADSAIRALGDKGLKTHQSASAVAITKGPKEVFLEGFRDPVKSGLQKIIDFAAEARGEQDLEPSLEGMEQLGDQDAQLEVVTGKMMFDMPLGNPAKILTAIQIIETQLHPTDEQWPEILEALKKVDFDAALAPQVDNLMNPKNGQPGGTDTETVDKKTKTKPNIQ